MTVADIATIASAVIIPMGAGLIVLYGSVRSIGTSVAEHIKSSNGRLDDLKKTQSEGTERLSADIKHLTEESSEMKITCAGTRSQYTQTLDDHGRRIGQLETDH